ncbi:MAG: DUF4185 domain-containing protein [Deltaproteobacteria bacterium]|nr:DUF4185 domain-containing protein [Deltaproteobacteria bacterium]
MRMSLRRAPVELGFAFLVGLCSLCACSGAMEEGTSDGGSAFADTTVSDSGAADTGVTNDAEADAGDGDVDDAGSSTDAGGGEDAQVVPDAGTTDSGGADTGTADVGVVDVGTVDTGIADAGGADTGTADTGAPDAGAADSGQGSGPVIESVLIEGDPIQPFPTNGDLWFTTWADDDALYSGWGDGLGVNMSAQPTDCGIARFAGTLPNISAEERNHDAPTANPPVNDKPSSLLYAGGRLYGHFHSPLGDAWIGYLAYSDDHGTTWTRLGFYGEGKPPPAGASPWTRDRNSPFRCLFFVNMGKAYALNTDGYVYGLGIGLEWGWTGGVYLTRVPVSGIADYGAYEYFSGLNAAEPLWNPNQAAASPLAGLSTPAQGSAMYHPGIGRYLFLTDTDLFEAPNPWGPWTLAAAWATKTMPVAWQGGYQPGIISKDVGPDYFWFTIAGQNQPPKVTYKLNLGKMVMQLRK